MFKRRLLLILLILLSLLTTACTERVKGPRLYLDNDFYWAIGQKETTVEDAMDLNYQHLEKLAYKNIRYLPGVGNDGKYVWLKINFTLPDELKNDDLSMLIPYIHFAEELYLNGEYIDDYGVIGEGAKDPDVQEAGLIAHLFDFPENFLNQEGENTILIRLLALGNSCVTPGVYIGLRDDCWATSDIMTFWRSRIYIFLEGFMLCVFIFFFMIFIAYRKDRIYFYLSFLSLISMFFFSSFFGGDLPWVGFHGGFSFLFYFKFTKCICFFVLEYVFSLFIFDFLQMEHTLAERLIRCTWLAISLTACIAAPDYYTLIRISHIVIWISMVDVTIAIGMIGISLIKGQRRERARMLLVALAPFLICVHADFIIKTFLNNITVPYLSMFGWGVTIILCFLYFSTQYNRIAINLERLNKNLKDEVNEQTRLLRDVNKKLANERDTALKDMHMAALVQQKFFHAPDQKFKNWDYAVCYEPCSEVSGDLFNFYYDESNLQGVSIFDASGHGVAASLITMLSENVIRTVYEESKKKQKPLSEVLSDLNKGLIEAKGEVDNFLTGILLNIKDKKNGACVIEIADAGHPYPLLYQNDSKRVIEIQPPVGLESYGPIGVSGIETHYTDFTFEMKKGDVLVLFTDGLTEQMNEHRQEFGKDKLGKILIETNRKNADSILQTLLARLDQHTGQEMRTDDVTVIILKKK